MLSLLSDSFLFHSASSLRHSLYVENHVETAMKKRKKVIAAQLPPHAQKGKAVASSEQAIIITTANFFDLKIISKPLSSLVTLLTLRD